jgi:hypothetical protein
MIQGVIPLERIPTSSGTPRVLLPRQLLDHGGLHFDDIDRASLRRRTRQYRLEAEASSGQLLCDRFHDFIAESNLSHPMPTTARR